MRFVIVLLLFVSIVGVYSVMSPILNPSGPIMSYKGIYEALLDENAETLRTQFFKDDTRHDDERVKV